MNKIIPREFIDNILLNSNIIDIIKTRIKIKKSGKNFYAYCPFHNENHPSFTISIEKQFYYCFGCEAHGNVIDFLINYENLTFIESIEKLAYEQGITVNNFKYLNYSKYQNRQELYQLMNKVKNFYKIILRKKENIKAFNYLINRGLNEITLKYFDLGFSSKNDNIIKYINNDNQIFKLLINSGIIVYNNKNTYDRFYDRIIFPIKNKYGQVIAFGGRTINEKIPKYLNSPETDIFQKRKQIYGLYEVKQQIKNNILPKLLIVEGYMDVITLFQFGINYAVSTLGTAISLEQVNLLYLNTDKIICCYDSDYAGYAAAWKILKNSLHLLQDNKQLLFMFLPKNEDPDSLVRKIGKEKFEKLIEKAQNLNKYIFMTKTLNLNLSNQSDRIKLGSSLLPLIEKIPGKLTKLILLKELSNKIGIVDYISLKNILSKKNITNNYLLYTKIRKEKIDILITLLIQHPWLAKTINNLNKLLKTQKSDYILLFIELIEICKSKPKLTTGILLEYYRNNKFYSYLLNLSIYNHMISNKVIKKTFFDILRNLYYSILEQYQEKLIARERIVGLTLLEKQKVWLLNKKLLEKNKIYV